MGYWLKSFVLLVHYQNLPTVSDAADKQIVSRPGYTWIVKDFIVRKLSELHVLLTPKGCRTEYCKIKGGFFISKRQRLIVAR